MRIQSWFEKKSSNKPSRVACADLICLLFCVGFTAAVSFGGCGTTDRKPKFGQSFNVIEGVTGSSYMLDGYSAFVESRSGAFAPYAVLVVGVKEGVALDGQQFDYGSIVVVEGTTTKPTFRLARPEDEIFLSSDVTIFGKKYSKGKFKVLSNGKILPSGS